MMTILGLLDLFIGIAVPGRSIMTSVAVAVLVAFGVVALSMWLPGCMLLTLDNKGFSIRSFWRDKRYEWTDVQEIREQAWGNKMGGGVVITLWSSGFLGLYETVMIIDMFRIRKAELASLMEQFHARATRNSI